jgi:thiosulfate/3-mercaptopyruvate sulfurtransferase
MKLFNLLVVGAIMSLALVGWASAQTSPKGLEVPIESAAIKFASDVKDGGYKIVSTAELKTWLDEGKKITIISTLPPADDKSLGILPSALNAAIPKTEKELTPADKTSLLATAGGDKDKTIVLYCGFLACRRSHIGAKILVEAGFKDVFRYPGGIIGWKEMGYPISK